MNFFPFFSVIIPSYNSAKFLEKCLGQCKNQTFKNFEIVITDDASQDSSDKIIKKFIAGNPEISITYIPSEINMGIGYSKGTGLKTAKGEYVVFHDSDDFMDSDFLECGYKYLKDKKIDKLRFQIRVLNAVTGKIRVRKTTKHTTEWTEAMFHATFFRREVFVTNGINFNTNKNVGEDLYIQTVFNKYCKSFLIVPEPKYTFLYREDSTSGYLTASIQHCIDFQEETLKAVKPFYDSFSNLKAADCKLMFTKQYYFMLLQYCRRLKFESAVKFYSDLRTIQLKYFPGYLKNKKITLFKDNGEPFFFRAVIFFCALTEKLHLTKPFLFCYLAVSKLIKFQTK